MSGLALKIIAIISMTLDHASKLLFDNNSVLIFIGRIAFPIFSYMLVQGYINTKNDKKRLGKYIIRLLIFALISEIPYRLCFNNSNLIGGNVLFELLFGIFALMLYDYLSKDYKLLGLVSIFSFALLSFGLNLDWGFWGILIIFAFYFYEKSNKKVILEVSLTSICLLMTCFYIITSVKSYDFASIINSLKTEYATLGIIFSIPIILSYNKKRGFSSKFLQLFFYAYYPLHLIILYLLKTLLGT